MHYSQSNFVSIQYLIQDDLDIKTYLDLSFFKSKKLTSLLAFFQSFKIIFISSATTVDELLTLTAGLIKVVSRKVSSAVSCLRWKGTYTLEKKNSREFSLYSLHRARNEDRCWSMFHQPPVPSRSESHCQDSSPSYFFLVRCLVNWAIILRTQTDSGRYIALPSLGLNIALYKGVRL